MRLFPYSSYQLRKTHKIKLIVSNLFLLEFEFGITILQSKIFITSTLNTKLAKIS